MYLISVVARYLYRYVADMVTLGDIAVEFVVEPRKGFGDQEYEGNKDGEQVEDVEDTDENYLH